MILIADGGSTKCDWILLNESGDVVLKTRSLGLNPAIISPKILTERILENKELVKVFNQVSKIYFYGAGCGTKRPTLALKKIFESLFKAAEVDVKEDTYAATYSVTNKPGIICILGTGSNSSYFDGVDVHTTIPSLGYILMDEASGNYFGKKLIRDYFYKKMPEDIRKDFELEFDLDADNIKENIYKKDNPNVYLAGFAEFLFRNDRNDYFNSVLKKGIKDFFKNRIKTHEDYQQVPVHFVGSIAFFSSDIINEVAKKYKVKIGNIVRRPIDGLIEYHREKLNIVN